MKRYILIFTLFIGLAISIVWNMFPATASKLLLTTNNAVAGLSAKTVDTQLGIIHYLEGGEGELLVLIHGIFARKEHWVDLAKELTKYYRVIALDLPGFGDNQVQPADQYQLENQADNLATVLDALDIQSAHFGVNSMAAMVTGLFAMEQPNRVNTLAFIGSPLGVPTVIKSDMQNAIAAGNIPLLVQSDETFDARNAWLFPEMPYLPSPILNTWRKTEVSQAQMNAQIWHAVNNNEGILNLLQIANNLTMRTLTVWCKQDRIFHISGAKILDEALPFSTLAILEHCGHLPMLDKPKVVAKHYADFLAKADSP